MPVPAKPCPGTFSEATTQLLAKNANRAQWLPHTCELCGQQVGAKVAFGKWSPEPHWPSVRYAPRTRRIDKRAPLQQPKSTPETWPDGAPI